MKRPVWLVTYELVDVSDDLGGMILAAEYTDHLTGKSDELSLTLEDRVGRWREGWFPQQGDRIAVQMGYEGAPLLDAGNFSVDVTELRGAPDTVQISALAAPQTAAMRTAQDRAWESATLREIAERIARELDLELLGDVADVRIDRVTQSRETSLAFLRRLARDYDYAFSIRPPYLTFFELAKLEAQPPVVTIRREDLLTYRLVGSTQDTYVACEVSWLDPQTGNLRRSRVEAAHARQRVVLASAVPTAPLELPSRTLRQGATGEDVRTWQTFLVSHGHDTGGIDGIFGPKTRAATMAFQAAHGIGIDGVAGPETYRTAQATGYGATQTGTRAEVSGKVLRREIRVETAEQAELRAHALLREANRLRVKGSFTVEGDRRLVAGVTVDLEDMGRLSGTYLAQQSGHRVSRDGYTTEIEVTCV